MSSTLIADVLSRMDEHGELDPDPCVVPAHGFAGARVGDKDMCVVRSSAVLRCHSVVAAIRNYLPRKTYC